MAKKDSKDVVLLALYAEYNKEAGDYRMVSAALLEMEHRVWLWSLMCLKTEGLVDGIKWIPPLAASADRVLSLHAKNLHLTAEGLNRARELLGDDGRNRKDALMRIIEWLGKLGLETAVEYLMRSL